MREISSNRQLQWIDHIKAIALVWVFINHVSERLFGFPYIANPMVDWPQFSERLAQLYPLIGYGFGDIPINLIRYLGWSGDQGVSLFLIVSGLGLTWGLLSVNANSLPLRDFYHRRLARIYPLWWGVHILFLAMSLLLGRGLALTDWKFYLSLIGIRITPDLFYYFAPAWWYIGLLIQLYLIYPFLWKGLGRLGPIWLLVFSCVLAFIARGIGLFFFDGYIDAWQRGAIFVTRLPEFVFGISFAAWLHRYPDQTKHWLLSAKTLFLALLAYLSGTVLSLTLLGMVFAPFLLGIGIFVLLYSGLTAISKFNLPVVGGSSIWVGQHSYALYLIHHPLILLFVPLGLSGGTSAILVGVGIALSLTIGSAIFLEWSVSNVQRVLFRWKNDVGLSGSTLRVGGILVTIAFLFVVAELAVRWIDPQEVSGWGERPSLEADQVFGWKLKPSTVTHLRWESYDYYVTANSLGFPGPEYAVQKSPKTLRIITVGDAFTSAEGVNTDQAWPRLLEQDLADKVSDRKIEVLNLAITGYGPNQYLAVLRSFAPVYHPDLIIVGFFMNDYQDVMTTNEEFQQSIGFDQPSQEGISSILRFSHLRTFTQLKFYEPLVALLRGNPNPHGYFLGNFIFLERDQKDFQTTGRTLVTERLREIKNIANGINAKVVILMIPVPVQVCKPNQLVYYPSNVNLGDPIKFDLDLPQRMTREIAASINMPAWDLRPVFQSTPETCQYQPRNMHWTPKGHSMVATYLTEQLLLDNYVEIH